MAEGVRKAGLIAYGVGISDCIHTARHLLDSGAERVRLLYCVRYAAEAVLRDEIDDLHRSYDGRFDVRYFLSRESDLTQLGIEGAAAGRLQVQGLEAAFGGWRDIAQDCAFLAVGTRSMCRHTYGLLAALGLGPRKLCGFKGTQRAAGENARRSQSDTDGGLLLS